MTFWWMPACSLDRSVESSNFTGDILCWSTFDLVLVCFHITAVFVCFVCALSPLWSRRAKSFAAAIFRTNWCWLSRLSRALWREGIQGTMDFEGHGHGHAEQSSNLFITGYISIASGYDMIAFILLFALQVGFVTGMYFDFVPCLSWVELKKWGFDLCLLQFRLVMSNRFFLLFSFLFVVGVGVGIGVNWIELGVLFFLFFFGWYGLVLFGGLLMSCLALICYYGCLRITAYWLFYVRGCRCGWVEPRPLSWPGLCSAAYPGVVRLFWPWPLVRGEFH